MDPPSAWRKAQDLISFSDNLAVDVMIRAIPRYHPICALISFRLHFSGLLRQQRGHLYYNFGPRRGHFDLLAGID